jgi:hypothetical protein
MRDSISAWRVNLARGVAVVADAAQLALIPLVAPGALSPFEDALDVGVGAALTLLVGWHWSFLPAFAIELVPTLDLAPTWTGAVLLATRPRGLTGEPRSPALTLPSGKKS